MNKFFSFDINHVNGKNQLLGIVRVEVAQKNDVEATVTVRAFVSSIVPNVFVNGARLQQAGTMRGTLNIEAGMIDGIRIPALSADVAKVVRDGIAFMREKDDV